MVRELWGSFNVIGDGFDVVENDFWGALDGVPACI